MSTFRELLEHSIDQHQRLHARMASIEKRLPILDLESTIQAAADLDLLFQEIQDTDQQFLNVIDTATTVHFAELIKKRMELGKNVLDQYQNITPKLQTRLAGYKAELLKIRHGLQTMDGYATPSSKAGRLINTSN